MKKRVYLLLIVIAIFFSIIFISNKSYAAGEQELKNLEFQAMLNSDGTADITEIWDVYIKNTNTLFKTFEIDNSKYSGITSVTITEITNNKNKSFKQIYQEKYHVDKDCFYALKNSKGEFEIAWGVSEDNSSARRTFKISYKVIDAIKNYSDCSEFYWQFVGSDFGISSNKVKGTITLPKSVNDIDDLRVWAHGPLNGNIERTSKNTVSFDVSSLSKKTMVEVRIVTPTYVFENNNNKYNTSKMGNILREEEKWANEANLKRVLSRVVFVLIIIAAFIVFNVFLVLMIKYIVDGRNLKKKFASKEFDFKYYRDIPDEMNTTPARAAFMYYFRYGNSTMSSYLPAVFSATVLDLSLKGIVSFEPIDKKDFYIIINQTVQIDLSEDERIILDLLIKASNGTYKVSSSELKKYSKKHYESVYNKLKVIPKKAEKYHQGALKFDTENEKLFKKWSNKATIYYTIFVLMFFLAFITGPLIVAFIPLLLCGIICTSNSHKIPVLRDKGLEEVAQWKGLKRYMEDFSLLKEKEVPDLVLWEKYLVYATAFGISDKVMEQLKVVYKELSDPNYFTTYNHFAYMHYMSNPNFGDNFISSFNKSMTSAYNAASSSYSSAHGGGGGFSGGGGGRRWRRPEAADVNTLKDYKYVLLYYKENNKKNVKLLTFFLCVFRYFGCCKFITSVVKFVICMTFNFYKFYFMNFSIVI